MARMAYEEGWFPLAGIQIWCQLEMVRVDDVDDVGCWPNL